MNTKTFICTFLLVTCALSSAFSASRTWPASCRDAGDPLTDPPGLQFDMDPTAYCSITNGATYTWNEYLENGSVRGAWSPTPPTQIGVGATARVTGYGWADLSISWSSGGGTSGSRNKSEKVGCFIIITAIPESKKKDNALISVVTWPLNFNSGTFGQYDLTLSGTMSLQAVYWKPEAGIPIQGGTWERNPGEINSKPIPSATTNWTVKKQRRCPKCGQGVSYFSQHQVTCSSSSCGERYWKCITSELNEHTATSHTVQNNGGGTVSSGGSTNSGCASISSSVGNAPFCNDKGNCTTRGSSTTNGSCGHRYCLCAPAPSTASNNGGSTGSGTGTGGTSSDRVQCGNAGTRRTSCNKGGYASSSTAHQSTCELGHTYWTCNVAQNNMHGVRHSNRTCVRCGTTFNSRTNGRCTSRWGTIYRWHWEG